MLWRNKTTKQPRTKSFLRKREMFISFFVSVRDSLFAPQDRTVKKLRKPSLKKRGSRRGSVILTAAQNADAG